MSIKKVILSLFNRLKLCIKEVKLPKKQCEDLLHFCFFLGKKMKSYYVIFFISVLFLFVINVCNFSGKEELTGVFISIVAAVIFESFRAYKREKNEKRLLEKNYMIYKFYVSKIIMKTFFPIEDKTFDFIYQTNIFSNDKHKDFIKKMKPQTSNTIKIEYLCSLMESAEDRIKEMRDIKNSYYESACLFYEKLNKNIHDEMKEFLSNYLIFILKYETDTERINSILKIVDYFSTPDLSGGFRSGQPWLTFYPLKTIMKNLVEIYN